MYRGIINRFGLGRVVVVALLVVLVVRSLVAPLPSSSPDPAPGGPAVQSGETVNPQCLDMADNGFLAFKPGDIHSGIPILPPVAAEPAPDLPPTPVPDINSRNNVQPPCQLRAASSQCPMGPTTVLAIAPFDGPSVSPEKDAIQRNSILALASLPCTKVFMFTSSSRYDDLAQLPNVVKAPRVITNKHGTPLLRHMMLEILSGLMLGGRYPQPVIGYVNADILLSPGVWDTLAGVREAVRLGVIKSRYLIVGKRTDCDASDLRGRGLLVQATVNGRAFPLRNERYPDRNRDSKGPLTAADVHQALLQQATSELHSEFGLDYFFMSADAFDWKRVPGFVIGRPAYDNWLVLHAIQLGIDTIDATRTITAVHQTGIDGKHAGFQARPDKMANYFLVRNRDGLGDGSTLACHWTLSVETARLMGFQLGDPVGLRCKRTLPYPDTLVFRRRKPQGEGRLDAEQLAALSKTTYCPFECYTEKGMCASTPNCKCCIPDCRVMNP